jgi:hypothetical protein
MKASSESRLDDRSMCKGTAEPDCRSRGHCSESVYDEVDRDRHKISTYIGCEDGSDIVEVCGSEVFSVDVYICIWGRIISKLLVISSVLV